MSKTICPICGSSDIESIPTTVKDTLPFGEEFQFKKIINKCKACGEEGEFTEENEIEYLEAIKIAEKISLEHVLTRFSNLGISMAYLERALNLPLRTLSRWKTQGTSASGMALMRVIRTYPWILKVADEDFDERFAANEVIIQSGKLIKEYLRKHYMLPLSLNEDQGQITEWNISGIKLNEVLLKEWAEEASVSGALTQKEKVKIEKIEMEPV